MHTRGGKRREHGNLDPRKILDLNTFEINIKKENIFITLDFQTFVLFQRKCSSDLKGN